MIYSIDRLFARGGDLWISVANKLGQLSRRKGAPYLWEPDPADLFAPVSVHLRTEIIAWLRWCDPNGTWSDADSIAEGHPPMTLDDALTQLEIMLEDEL